MYTQCPDCSTAFRVTADVLKVAAGKVRCGGCGNAFNALEFLSESMPQQPIAKDADEALPELKPEPIQKTDGLPASISAEQSAALLKTLDELAGSDIRIEDTGVEWRVLDDDDVGEAGSEPVANEANADALPANDVRADQDVDHSSGVDELLEESPTPVDQFLTDTPPQIDSPEIFAEVGDKPATTSSVDELRFDDDTPLPDDFDLDDESLFDATPVIEPEEPRDEPAAAKEPEPQADLDLSEPDEWTDILGEFEDLAVAVAAPLEDEIAELEEPEQPEDLDEIEATETEPEPETSEQKIDAPLDMDSQFALQAEAMGIDLSGLQEALETPEVQEEIDLELFLDAGDEVDRDIEELLDEDLVEEVDDKEFLEEELDEEPAEPDSDDEPEAEEVLDEPDEDAQLKLIEDDEDVEEEDVVVDEPEELEEFDELDEPEEDDSFDIAPLTEEEQTINMQIDQDLLALAIEDEDGFASTIVIAEEAAESKAREKKKKKKDKKKKDKKTNLDLTDTSAGFETIIMEGEHIRSGLDFDQSGMEAEAAASLAAAAAEREAAAAASSGGRNWGMIGGAVALVLLLAIQVLHQSREALATIPAFHDIASPLYRAIGMPLSPNWDVTGWRFEATQLREAATDESETADGSEDVTIVSRIGNNSDKPLPYPIVGVFQTVRLNEEPVGGLALDPADYLPDDLDPRKLVEPGNSFNAVMTIRSESAEDTSFRLRVCYRNVDGSLRCKNDSFKND